jgi:hypothetical protein
MIVRNEKGELVWLNKYDFPTDKLFYQKICWIKYPFTKLTGKKDTHLLIEKSFGNESFDNKNN